MVGQARLSAPRLEVRDLWVHAPGTTEPVVRGAAMEVAQGEWVAVTGPNGCGKTTLAHAIAGLQPHARGEVLVDGAPLAATSADRARARIAVVLQDPSTQLFESTVADEIAFAPRNLGWDEPRIHASTMDWSRRLDLVDDLDADPRELSAGRQQLVLMAAALVSDPSLLVADEAAAHLDPATRRTLIGLLRQEARRGLSIIWVTQHPEEARAADRVVRLPAPHEQPLAKWSSAVVEPALASRVQDSTTALDVRLRPLSGPARGPCVRIREVVSFRVEPGRVVALMGPNGSGKTAVLESIAGLMDVGQIELSWTAPGRFGPVLASQYPDLQIVADTVRKEIEFAAQKRGTPSDEYGRVIDELLRVLDLDPTLLERSPWEVSSGERRLVQLIATLVAPASVVLLDEPTGGIDPGRSEALARVIVSRSACSLVLIASQDEAWVGRIGACRVALGN